MSPTDRFKQTIADIQLASLTEKGMQLLNGKWLPLLVALVLILLLGQQAAALTWRLLLNQDSVQSSQQLTPELETRTVAAYDAVVDAQKIARLNLFGEANKVKEVAKKTEEIAPETRLNLTLHGVYVGVVPEQSAAIIGQKAADQKYYSVGGQVMNGVLLKEVHQDHVVLSRNGKSEILRFPKPNDKAGPMVARAKRSPLPNSQSSLKQYADLIKQEPFKVFEHLRFVPVRRGKVTRGYRVLPQKNRKLYDQTGLRPTDLVQAVNGVKLDDEKKAMALMGTIKEAQTLDLEVLRNGQVETLTLNLN